MKLEDHLNKLPNHSIKASMWDHIEQQLPSTQEKLVDRLPLHTANSDIWFSIEQHLSNLSLRRRVLFQQYAAAASVLVILTLGTVYYAQRDTEYIYYSDEIYIESTTDTNFELINSNVLDNCSDYPDVCKTPNFTRLKNTLDRLKQDEQKLRTMKVNMNDSKIDLYHSRIVKDIQQVEAQLLQMFI